MIYSTYESVELWFLTRLQLGFRHLRGQNFKKVFYSNALNPTYSRSIKAKSSHIFSALLYLQRKTCNSPEWTRK